MYAETVTMTSTTKKPLSMQSQHQPQYTMSSRMSRTEVQYEL